MTEKAFSIKYLFQIAFTHNVESCLDTRLTRVYVEYGDKWFVLYCQTLHIIYFTVCLIVDYVMFIVHKVIKTHQIERTLRIAKELSDLIVYCRPVSYDTEKGKLIKFDIYCYYYSVYQFIRIVAFSFYDLKPFESVFLKNLAVVAKCNGDIALHHTCLVL